MADEDDEKATPVVFRKGRPKVNLGRVRVQEKPGIATRSFEALTQALTQTFGGQSITNVAAGKGVEGAVGGVSATQVGGAVVGGALFGLPGAAGGSLLGSLIEPARIQERPDEVVRRLGLVPTFANTLATAILTDPLGSTIGLGVERDFAIATKFGIKFVRSEAKPLIASSIVRVSKATGMHAAQAHSEVVNLLSQALSRPTEEILKDRVLVTRLGVALGTKDTSEIAKAIEFTKNSLEAKSTVRIAGKEIPKISALEARRRAFVDRLKESVRRSVEPFTPLPVGREFLTKDAIRFRQAVEDAMPPSARAQAHAIFERAVQSRGASARSAEDAGALAQAAKARGITDVEGFFKEPSNVVLQGPLARSTSRFIRSSLDLVDDVAHKFGIRKFDSQLETMHRDYMRRVAFQAADLRDELTTPYLSLTPAELRAASQIPDVTSATVIGIRNETERAIAQIRKQAGGSLSDELTEAIAKLRAEANAGVIRAYEDAVRALPGDLPQKVFKTQERLKQIAEVLHDEGILDAYADLYIRHNFRNPRKATKVGFPPDIAVQTETRGMDIQRVKNAITGNPLFGTIEMAQQLGLEPETDLIALLTSVANDSVSAIEGRRFLKQISNTFGVPETDFVRHIPVAPDDIRGAIADAHRASMARAASGATENALRVDRVGVASEAASDLENYARLGRVYEVPESQAFAPQVESFQTIEGLPPIEVARPAPPSQKRLPSPGETAALEGPRTVDVPSEVPLPAHPLGLSSDSIVVDLPASRQGDFVVEKVPVRVRSDIAQALKEMAPTMMSKESASEIVRVAGVMNDLFKASVTILPPATIGFTVKQFIGNAFNGLLGIGLRSVNPFSYVAPYRMLLTSADDVWKTEFGQWSFSELRRMFHEEGLETGLGARLQLSQQAMTQQGTIGRIRQIGFRRTVREKGGFGTFRGISQDIASFPDRIARAQLFMHHIQAGLDPRSAAALTRQFVHDVSQLTPFEQRVVRELVPFYAWPRRNIPLQLRQMMERPTFPSITLHTFDALGPSEREKAQAPDYLLDQIQVAMGLSKLGAPLLMGSLSLPIEDVMRLLPTEGFRRVVEREVLGRVTPILTIPAQEITGRVFFTGREVRSRQDVPAYFESIPGLSQYLDIQVERTARGQKRYSADAGRLQWLQGYIFSRSYNALTRAVNPNVPIQWKLLDLFTGIRVDAIDAARAKNSNILRTLDRLDKAGQLRSGKYFYAPRTREASRAIEAFNTLQSERKRSRLSASIRPIR